MTILTLKILIAQLFEGARYINLVNDGKESLTLEDIQLFRKYHFKFLI